MAAEGWEGAIGLRPADARRLSRTVECRNYGRHFAADEMARLLTLMADPPPLNHHAMLEEYCRRIGCWLGRIFTQPA